ncbi:MAG: CoA pyrophosphatase [Gammaproteobacteria bacterium]|nr:CoA pyrophosphatase [Gammaproteobacteria bacterium]
MAEVNLEPHILDLGVRARRCLVQIAGFDATVRTDPISDGTDQATPAAGAALIPAAVLVPLVLRPQGLSVLLTRRTEHLDKHAGQVSFPGGHVETHDRDYVATALRETEEEIGLRPGYIHVVGALDECLTVTGYRVVPVVGLVHPGFDLRPDRFEVEEVFEVPLEHIFEPANHARDGLDFLGRRREFYVIQYQRHRIWGATAAILVNFYARALAERLVDDLVRWRPNAKLRKLCKIGNNLDSE